ncbi:hypothetical protein PC128_g6756 [Phytophthora cactorum]|nr:hypothetical protein PC128_g6756 [Phytophthora cactorum]
MVTDGCAATYRRRLIVKSHDELDGRRRDPDVQYDEGYPWRRPAGHRDRMPGADKTRSPTKDRWPKIADRRTENEIAERRTGSPNGERERLTENGERSSTERY